MLICLDAKKLEKQPRAACW